MQQLHDGVLALIAHQLPTMGDKANMSMVSRTFYGASHGCGGVWWGLTDSTLFLDAIWMEYIVYWLRKRRQGQSAESITTLKVDLLEADVYRTSREGTKLFPPLAASFWSNISNLCLDSFYNGAMDAQVFHSVQTLSLDLKDETPSLTIEPSMLPPHLKSLSISGCPQSFRRANLFIKKLPATVTELSLSNVELDAQSFLQFRRLTRLLVDGVQL